jgi:hypothetical protein
VAEVVKRKGCIHGLLAPHGILLLIHRLGKKKGEATFNRNLNDTANSFCLPPLSFAMQTWAWLLFLQPFAYKSHRGRRVQRHDLPLRQNRIRMSNQYSEKRGTAQTMPSSFASCALKASPV